MTLYSWSMHLLLKYFGWEIRLPLIRPLEYIPIENAQSKFIIHHRKLRLVICCIYLKFRLLFPTCIHCTVCSTLLYNVDRIHVSCVENIYTIFNNIFLIAYQIFTFFYSKILLYHLCSVSYRRRRVGNYLVIPNNKIFQLFSHTFTATEKRKRIQKKAFFWLLEKRWRKKSRKKSFADVEIFVWITKQNTFSIENLYFSSLLFHLL